MTIYHDELVWAYDGEVMGEALFTVMADRLGRDQRAGHMALIALLERQTREQLGRLLERDGLAGHDEKAAAKGAELGERSARAAWDRFLASFAPATAQALDRYHAMQAMAPEADQPTMAALVAHEEALQRYAELAMASQVDPAAPLLDALDGANAAVARFLLAGSA